MNFELIDMEHWDRAECYQHFTTVAKSTYSITVDLDITELFRYVREKNVRFFPAFHGSGIPHLQRQMKVSTLFCFQW